MPSRRSRRRSRSRRRGARLSPSATTRRLRRPRNAPHPSQAHAVSRARPTRWRDPGRLPRPESRAIHRLVDSVRPPSTIARVALALVLLAGFYAVTLCAVGALLAVPSLALVYRKQGEYPHPWVFAIFLVAA